MNRTRRLAGTTSAAVLIAIGQGRLPREDRLESLLTFNYQSAEVSYPESWQASLPNGPYHSHLVRLVSRRRDAEVVLDLGRGKGPPSMDTGMVMSHVQHFSSDIARSLRAAILTPFKWVKAGRHDFYMTSHNSDGVSSIYGYMLIDGRAVACLARWKLAPKDIAHREVENVSRILRALDVAK